jgi:hypothetical protein
MRIAIFGDSFADDKSWADRPDKCWADILRAKGITVHNYAVSGSSLQYSWKKYWHFKTDPATWPIWNDCDKVIFVITGQGRESINIDGDTFYLTGLAQIEVLRDRFRGDPKKYQLFSSICDYWKHIKDHETDKIFHQLLIEKIKTEPKLLYIEAFSTGEIPDNGPWRISDISMKELSFYDSSVQTYEDEREFMVQYQDHRKCHLSEENNIMLANKVYDAVVSDAKTIEFSPSDLMKPALGLDYYFEKYDF